MFLTGKKKSTLDDQPGKLEALTNSLKYLPMIYPKHSAFIILGYTRWQHDDVRPFTVVVETVGAATGGQQASSN
jgi:hypothetical protein